MQGRHHRAARQKDLDEAEKLVGPSAALAVQGDVSGDGRDLDRFVHHHPREIGQIGRNLRQCRGLGAVVPLALGNRKDNLTASLRSTLKELFFTVQKALPLLSDGASIIVNSSIAGFKGMEGMSVYSATKAAVRSFARTWTSDLKARKIRVNSISPGALARTPIFGKMGLTGRPVAWVQTGIAGHGAAGAAWASG